MTIKLLSFDLDNTLYDNTEVIKTAEYETKRYLKEKFEKQQFEFDYSSFLQIKNNLILENKKTQREINKFENLTHLRHHAILKFCEELPESTLVAKQALDIFLIYRSRIHVSATIQNMLSRLSKKYLLVTVTNGNCDPNKTQLSSYFSRNYSPSNGLRAKPHPQMLETVFKDFKLAREQVLHIGDQVETDEFVAKNAGCHFHLFTPFKQHANEFEVCCDLLERLM